MRSLSTAALLVSFFIAECVLSGASAALPQRESNVHERTIDGTVVQSERDEQEALFNYYFRHKDLTYETKLSELKKEASVAKWRIPYSAAIHAESGGGLADVRGARARNRRGGAAMAGGSSALSVYDRAFNGGEDLANSYEIRRIMGRDRAIFPGLRMRLNSESWEGYCSGFTASTIKHPEPVKPVDAGTIGGASGVVFQPEHIKALLTGIYNRTTDDSYLYLAPASAGDGGPNMGTFHLALANYIGKANHPVGIDRTKGETSWNNPIYSYKVTSLKDAGKKDGVEYKNVSTTVTYSFYGSDSRSQTDPETGARVGNQKQSMTFRYRLALDDEGRIIGGRALSSNGNFLWIPLYAVQGREDGSVPGNPYIDVRKVIALAEASALPAVQKKYDESTIGPKTDPSLDEEGEEAEEGEEGEEEN